MMEYLEGRMSPTFRPCAPCCAKVRWKCAFVPVLGGSAFQEQRRSAAAQRCDRFLPAAGRVDYMGFKPGDEEEVRNIARRADDNMAFSGLAFKIMNDPFVGSLTFTRVYSGVMTKAIRS